MRLALRFAALPLIAAALPVLANEAMFRVRADNPSDRALLGREFAHAHFDAKTGDWVVEANQSQLAILQEAGLSAHYDMELSSRMAWLDQAFDRSIPGFGCYRTVVETNALIDSLAANYPALVSVIDIGDSWRKGSPTGSEPGFDLRVLKLTNGAIAGPKPRMFVMSGLHAREYTPVEVNARFAEWLLSNYQTDANARWLLDHNEFHLLLQANPDGRIIAENGQSQRKNRRDHAACSGTGDGIDLNRNFQIDYTGSGSSTSLCNETYRGASVLSEPESNAVNTYIASIFPDTKPGALTDYANAASVDSQGLYLDVHSFSELVLWPWGFPGSPSAPNNSALQTLGRRLAFFNGYSPEQSNSLPASGASDDNAYGSLGVAAYTMELGTAFFQDCNTFSNTILPTNLNALRYGARVLHRPYQMPSGPDTRNLQVTPTLPFPGETITISALADDTQFNQSNGSELTHNISASTAYFDQLPWAAGATPIPVSAADGSFNASVETLSANLSTTGLSIGEHLLYLQSTDSSGALGPPAAAFVRLVDPQTVGTLSGVVREFGSSAPLVADITVAGSAVRSDAAGAYSFRSLPATVSAVASKPGYLDENIAGINIAAGLTTTSDFTLYPTCNAFVDNAETVVAGWTTQGPWARVSTAGPAGTPSMVWSDSPAGNYGNNINLSLTTPSLNFSGRDGVRIEFDHRCNTETGFDYGRVEISTGGGAWTEVFRCEGANGWQHQRIELATFNNVANAQLRFRISSDGSEVRDGWQLDNIRIESAGQLCRDSYNAVPGDGLFGNGFE